MQTLGGGGGELGFFRQELQDTDIRPRVEGAVAPHHFAHEHLAGRISFSPVRKKTKPCLFSLVLVLFGARAYAWLCTERGTIPDGHTAVAFPHGTEGFD